MSYSIKRHSYHWRWWNPSTNWILQRWLSCLVLWINSESNCLIQPGFEPWVDPVIRNAFLFVIIRLLKNDSSKGAWFLCDLIWSGGDKKTRTCSVFPCRWRVDELATTKRMMRTLHGMVDIAASTVSAMHPVALARARELIHGHISKRWLGLGGPLCGSFCLRTNEMWLLGSDGEWPLELELARQRATLMAAPTPRPLVYKWPMIMLLAIKCGMCVRHYRQVQKWNLPCQIHVLHDANRVKHGCDRADYWQENKIRTLCQMCLMSVQNTDIKGTVLCEE